MCFSANASFAASGVLAAVGAASIRETKTKRGLLYAFIPVFFSIQQLIEGFQWLAPASSSWRIILAYGFLFFALILWPVYVPVSVYLIETQVRRKKQLGYFIALGAVVSVYSLVCFIVYPIGVSVNACCHVAYFFNIPFEVVVAASYVVATCGSMFSSSHGWVRVMSVVSFVAFIVSYLFATRAYISVWCFLAAILSTLVLLHVRSEKHPRVI